jgi:hypothetical protein
MEFSDSSDVPPLGLGVHGNDLADKDTILAKATRIGKALRQILEKLGSRNSVAGEELVVEGEQETQLNGNGSLRDRLVRIVGQDNTGNVSR